MPNGFLPARRAPSYRLHGVESASSSAGPRSISARALALAGVALLATGGALSGCGSNKEASTPPPPASSSAGTEPQTSTHSARDAKRKAFDDEMAKAGIDNLPSPVSDTLATLASNVCAAGGGESQKDERIKEIMPVAESVASLVPETDANQVADTVYRAGIDNFCP